MISSALTKYVSNSRIKLSLSDVVPIVPTDEVVVIWDRVIGRPVDDAELVMRERVKELMVKEERVTVLKLMLLLVEKSMDQILDSKMIDEEYGKWVQWFLVRKLGLYAERAVTAELARDMTMATLRALGVVQKQRKIGNQIEGTR